MKTYSIIIIFLLVHIDVDSQVPNPRIPAEWEEIQAIIMEPNLYPRKDKRWYDVIDPYIKVAEPH